jgi:hypothetical protein
MPSFVFGGIEDMKKIFRDLLTFTLSRTGGRSKNLRGPVIKVIIQKN